jgi:ABC-type polysaccharide/polyol phosphate transport system ATPase subunit
VPDIPVPTLTDTISSQAGAEALKGIPSSAPPVVIEARGVGKTFRIPEHRVDSLKERATRPFTRMVYRELQALRDVSFDVHKGEFFGIVGRNGSGKSSLLKIMASIYRADAGRVRMAGRLAPFIELGVGFNLDLTARENVALNGVMMGLTRREAARSLDAVLEFAELEDFVELKLKNYSSGMLVRLAFATMIEAEADVMLIDEVLAVGDAAFSQKCMDVFRERRRAGKTIVLVTHDMSTVQSFCDRAMLLHDGERVYIGDAEETALRYYRLNFHGGVAETPQVNPDSGLTEAPPGAIPDVNVRVLDGWIEDASGGRTNIVEQGQPIRLHALFEARHELVAPVFGFHFHDNDGARIFGFNKTLGIDDPDRDLLETGRRVRISATIENRLLPGRYVVQCWVSRNRTAGDLALHGLRLLEFVVYGTRPGPGSVAVESEVEAVIEHPGERNGG